MRQIIQYSCSYSHIRNSSCVLPALYIHHLKSHSCCYGTKTTYLQKKNITVLRSTYLIIYPKLCLRVSIVVSLQRSYYYPSSFSLVYLFSVLQFIVSSPTFLTVINAICSYAIRVPSCFMNGRPIVRFISFRRCVFPFLAIFRMFAISPFLLSVVTFSY